MNSQRFLIIKLLLLQTLLPLALALSDYNQTECAPRQVRLLIGDDYIHSEPQSALLNTATIIFQTYAMCIDSYIKVTIENRDVVYSGQSGIREIIHSKWNGEQFCHNGKSCENLYYDQYSHIFRLPIETNKEFTYTVFGSELNLSKSFNSILPSLQDSQKTQRILFYGDQDLSPQARINLNRISELKKRGKNHSEEKIDSFLFLGDYGYEFYQRNGKMGDNYLQLMEQYIAEWPTVFAPGNHEEQYNFKFFNEKFQLPNFKETKNNYFAFNQGLIHFVGVNLHYFSHWASDIEKAQMLSWLDNDLQKANQNRAQRPWIIAFGHKAIYCVQNDDCSNLPKIYRQMDDLFYNHSVDLYLGAHVHYQEYLKPMYRESIQKYEGNHKELRNPQGMITFIQGNGGQKNEYYNEFKENIKFIDRQNSRSFEVKYNVGYGILEVIDKNKICILNFNSYFNTQGRHCIISQHKFNHDSFNTEIINESKKKKYHMNWELIFCIVLSIVLSVYFSYTCLRDKDDD